MQVHRGYIVGRTHAAGEVGAREHARPPRRSRDAAGEQQSGEGGVSGWSGRSSRGEVVRGAAVALSLVLVGVLGELNVGGGHSQGFGGGWRRHYYC